MLQHENKKYKHFEDKYPFLVKEISSVRFFAGDEQRAQSKMGKFSALC